MGWDQWHRVGPFLRDLIRRGPVSWRIRLVRIVLAVGFAAGFVVYVTQTGNPHLDNQDSVESAASAWRPPPRNVGPVDPALPPGFPYLEFPPSTTPASNGMPQPVPTRYGLTYAVPSGTDWMASNETVLGFVDEAGQATIATYAAVSRYRVGYCPEIDTSKLAYVGVTGRNGIDVASAARQEIDKTAQLFSDAKVGGRPTVEIRGPIEFEIGGRPAVRYTAAIYHIPKRASCEPDSAEFDVIATPGYASAEVAVFVVERHIDLKNSLKKEDIDSIVRSIRKTG
ncbi:hypothetical protein [Nocardia sp. NPDC050175]|uniref:hypothetical protein n=1 Tax=Nocardia sp. NPDC050175 TaxID=3364317 RepID=UPI0037AC76DF